MSEITEQDTFTRPTQSVQINTSNHSMSITRKLEGNSRVYYFYDPNYGIVRFSEFEKMKKFMNSHMSLLSRNAENSYHFYGDVNLRVLDFETILPRMADERFNGQTFEEIIGVA